MNLKKALTAIFLSVAVQISFAQTKESFQMETQSGYEYNYFKSPDELLVNDSILDGNELISSSFYQDFEAFYKYRYKKKRNRVRFVVNPFSRIFYQNPTDSYWSLNLKADHDYKLSKTTVLTNEARFTRMNRDGVGGNQDVIVNPLGYTNYGASSVLEFKPKKKNKTQVEAFFNFRNFDEYASRNLSYHELGIKASNIYTFKVKRLKHKVGVTVYAKKRLYKTLNASEGNIQEGSRNWDYVKGVVFYEIPFSKRFKIKPNIEYYQRIDNTRNRSSFQQFGSGLSFKYDNKKTKVRGSISYLKRYYSTIEAVDEEEGKLDENLRYNYLNFQLNASHKIKNRLSLTAAIHSRIRETNYTDISAVSFRSYSTYFLEFGILFKM